MYERMNRMGDRLQNIVNKFRTIFNVKGNDAEAIVDVISIWLDLAEFEYTTELAKLISKLIVTKCPWTTDYKDISDWDVNTFVTNMAKTVNPKATIEQPKNMCAGDSYCEFIFKIEE